MKFKLALVEFGVYMIFATTLFLACELILKLDSVWKERIQRRIEDSSKGA
jgi:hypothetical protein